MFIIKKKKPIKNIKSKKKGYESAHGSEPPHELLVSMLCCRKHELLGSCHETS